MVTCWASALGDCDSKQSAEHYVTRGLWSSPAITISGFDWQNGEAKLLPVGSLESKILCASHNNRLSEIDSEAIRITQFLEEAVNAFSQPPPAKLPLFPQRYHADGPLFERWCAKTLIDFVCVERSDARWHDTGTPLLEPPLDVVKAVYGITKFQHPMGLYLAQESTEKPQNVLREELGVDPRFHPNDGGLMGAFLSFRDFRFLIWLSLEPFESFATETRSGVLFGESGNPALYHPDSLKVQVNYVVRHKVILNWH